jgi:hypothetical protein
MGCRWVFLRRTGPGVCGSTMVHKRSGLISKFLRLPLPSRAYPCPAHLSFRCGRLPNPHCLQWPRRLPFSVRRAKPPSSAKCSQPPSNSRPGGIFAHWLISILPGLLWAGTDRPQEAPDLPNLGSHGLAQVHALASPAPMPEIAVALAPRSARASCPTVHAAAWPTCYRCLSTGVTGSSPRSTAPSFGQIGEPSVNVSLTYGVVCHS